MTDYEKAVGILGANKMQEINNSGLTVISQGTLNRLKFENEEMTESIEQFDQLRPAVVDFAKEMEKKLKDNDHKVHWSECSFDYLISRLKQETNELIEAIVEFKRNPSKKTRQAVIGEASDCGNFSMMIADNMKSNFYGKRRF